MIATGRPADREAAEGFRCFVEGGKFTVGKVQPRNVHPRPDHPFEHFGRA
jgi:hypothetical protein